MYYLHTYTYLNIYSAHPRTHKHIHTHTSTHTHTLILSFSLSLLHTRIFQYTCLFLALHSTLFLCLSSPTPPISKCCRDGRRYPRYLTTYSVKTTLHLPEGGLARAQRVRKRVLRCRSRLNSPSGASAWESVFSFFWSLQSRVLMFLRKRAFNCVFECARFQNTQLLKTDTQTRPLQAIIFPSTPDVSWYFFFFILSTFHTTWPSRESYIWNVPMECQMGDNFSRCENVQRCGLHRRLFGCGLPLGSLWGGVYVRPWGIFEKCTYVWCMCTTCVWLMCMYVWLMCMYVWLLCVVDVCLLKHPLCLYPLSHSLLSLSLSISSVTTTIAITAARPHQVGGQWVFLRIYWMSTTLYTEAEAEGSIIRASAVRRGGIKTSYMRRQLFVCVL